MTMKTVTIKDQAILGGIPVFLGRASLSKTCWIIWQRVKPLMLFWNDFPSVSREQILQFLHEISAMVAHEDTH
jgi:hypothetical protein